MMIAMKITIKCSETTTNMSSTSYPLRSHQGHLEQGAWLPRAVHLSRDLKLPHPLTAKLGRVRPHGAWGNSRSHVLWSVQDGHVHVRKSHEGSSKGAELPEVLRDKNERQVFPLEQRVNREHRASAEDDSKRKTTETTTGALRKILTTAGNRIERAKPTDATGKRQVDSSQSTRHCSSSERSPISFRRRACRHKWSYNPYRGSNITQMCPSLYCDKYLINFWTKITVNGTKKFDTSFRTKIVHLLFSLQMEWR